ncbi:MAG: hypothetical protein AAGJ35_11805, partial [Myxococcota bacterium]
MRVLQKTTRWFLLWVMFLGLTFCAGPRANEGEFCENSGECASGLLCEQQKCALNNNDNRPPLAVFFVSPKSPYVGDQVTLDARRSSDPEGTALKFSWSLAQKPEQSKLEISLEQGAEIQFTPDVIGEYLVRL